MPFASQRNFVRSALFDCQMRAAVLIALVLLSPLVAPVQATFPGRNGDLLVNERARAHWVGFETSTLWRISPGSGQATRSPVCWGSSAPSVSQPECAWTGPPASSPDGRSVAFAAVDVGDPPYTEPATFSVRVLSLATGAWTLVPLAGRTLPYETPIRWTRDLNFVVAANPRQVVLAGSDGSDRGSLLARASAPDVSSGGRVAFVRRGNVHLVKRDGTVRRLTGRGGDQPSWSPRGKSVAFTRKGWVYTVPARGGPVRRLTRGFNPVWSPDGKQIAFFRAIRDPEYGQNTTYLFALDRRTGRVRRVSSQVMAVP
ncbi:MAG TPA: hypothetical protein VNS49_17945, partial [Streptomyces sp.]|nr:hypothetical protein [Streptomyces sp.]